MSMEHREFKIGMDFWTMTGKWRCTDVGTRTVAAIKHQIDPRNMEGPPYSIAERVFDEHDMEGTFPSLRVLADSIGWDSHEVSQLRRTYGDGELV